MAKPKKTAVVAAKPPPEKDPETGRFLTGNVGGGRPKGARNRLGEDFIADMHADWIENGPAVIKKVRDERPQDYLKVVASILPKELNVKLGDYDEMTDEELDRRIKQLAVAVADEIGAGEIFGGEATPTPAQQARPI